MDTPSSMFKFCYACGERLHPDAEICPKCGVRQKAKSGAKNRITAALFALFLGGVGIHKFYLGQIGWGFVYLIFCWTLVPALVGFIEFIIFLSMSDAAFSEKYG